MHRYLLIITLLAIILVFVETIEPHLLSPAWSQSETDAQEETSPKKPKKGIIDAGHQTISKSLLITAKWLDAFFSNEQHEDEENRSTLRVQTTAFQEEGEDAQFDAKVRVRLLLPRTEDKLQLVFSGYTDEELDIDDTRDEKKGQLSETSDEKDTSASLWYFLKSTIAHNVSTRVGVRLKSGKAIIYAGPRYRYFKNLEKWSFRFTESVRWYSDTGWESITGLDFERPLVESLLFRTHIGGAWYEEKTGYFSNLTFSLYQTLGHKRALEYSWSNDFETRPIDRLTESALRIRYRQTIWREWLFLEITPQVRFPADQDYDTIPGISIKLEAVFGNIM